jgi:hypothetical protein
VFLPFAFSDTSNEPPFVFDELQPILAATGRFCRITAVSGLLLVLIAVSVVIVPCFRVTSGGHTFFSIIHYSSD